VKIAVWYHLPAGGGKRAVHDQVEGLLSRGHQVEVWMPSRADRAFMPLPESARQHVLPLEWSEPGMSRLQRWLRPASYARRLRAMREHAATVGEAVRGFDVLLAHSCAWYAAPHVARSSSVPCAVYLHEPCRALHEAGEGAPVWCGPAAPSERTGLAGRVNEVLEYWRDLVWQRQLVREEWRNARAASTLLVNSWFTSESAMRAYGRRGTVCEPGVDVRVWTDPGSPRERLVVGLGAIASHKGVAEAVATIAALDEGLRREVRLAWYGQKADAAYVAVLERSARERGVALEIRVGVPELEIRQALQRASVFLYPSRLEPFGYAPLEAAACGCPVVAVREGGPRETLVDGQTGFLTDGSIAGMAGAVGMLLADTGRARAMGAAARLRVEQRYSLPASIDRLEAALGATAGMA
jgi:glycosyltransferase involved in cell wall biosynthesis